AYYCALYMGSGISVF
nr:immunoglobulin light chain junction region [Macaca mulatta]MOY05218.1 immunoglobulin light chain junction region [Macaca mulatta]MOY05349.1 immunoglobulin light chain junction region [Macaca mulatta]MOY05724.1 immunoglobulin light chain junction region [Macaca mulatta]MOY05881.1 immunoglobulin light chain junction region [Macaca mulatta]